MRLAAAARRALARLRTSLPATRRRLAAQDVMLLAAGLTFYAAIGIVPMLLLALFLAGGVIGHERLERLADRLAEFAPEGLGFSARLAEVVEVATSLPLLAVAAAIIPATTYGEGLVRAFDRLAGVSTRGKGLTGRVRAIALFALWPLLVLGALGVVAFLPGALGGGPGWTALGVYLTFWAAWIGGWGILAVTYRAFTPVPVAAGPLLVASAATGSFLAGMSLGWVLLLEVGVEVGRAYGGSEELGAAVLFLLYLFLVQLTCLVGYAWALDLQRPAPEPMPHPGP